jgi:hypothetical protein
MKRDLLTSILALVLLASSLAAAAMCYKALRTSAENRFLQEQVARVSQRRALLQNFAVDLNEYSLKNPAIAPLLDQMNLRMRAVTNTLPLTR